MSPVGKDPSHTICFLLHAHLPYAVRPELDFSLEEAWLHEAIVNCYLPLIEALEKIGSQSLGTPFLTLSLSPTLIELWKRPHFASRFENHLCESLKIIEAQIADPRLSREKRIQAEYIHTSWTRAHAAFEAINGDLLQSFVRLQLEQKIELITTAATHPFFPAFQSNREFISFQIRTGIKSFRKHTGIKPCGFWLPECGYFPGLEEELDDFDIEFFGLEAGKFRYHSADYDTTRPNRCKNGVYALPRDQILSQKVWSARSGYPGNEHYRDFHQDDIHDLDTSQTGYFALPDGRRIPLGLKYWRVSSTSEKAWYCPKKAKLQAQLDAEAFQKSILSGPKGIKFLPFDAELFGHWWHEGPIWLERLFQLLFADEKADVASVSMMLKGHSSSNLVQPLSSSWGKNADASFWVNHETDWIYPKLVQAFEVLKVQAKQRPRHTLAKEMLQQASRELLLASASDWPFMITGQTTAQLGTEQVEKHLKRFYYLIGSPRKKPILSEHLSLLKETNPLFAELDLLELLCVKPATKAHEPR